MSQDRKVWIVNDETNTIERTIETSKTGSNYDQMLLGMFRKVDLERFSIVTDEDDLKVRGIVP